MFWILSRVWNIKEKLLWVGLWYGFFNIWVSMFKFVFLVMKIEYYSLVIVIKVWVLVKLIKLL